MSVSIGTRFGAYEITGRLGVGGMGEVWRARDTELKRDVAVKVLAGEFGDDPDRLARFRREAEMLATLNHPNIAQIHGLEKADGQLLIVMELVDGPTLADRIAEGPIPPDEALAVARQIADALEAAHDKQIVHRDLKPSNIKLRADGTVKVLDFGISKPIDARAISGGSPVQTTPVVTETGVILGTAAYMSPEQARGRFVDERTDIWAFGCLLFEMLTGQPVFGGEDVMLTLARVLDRDTDLSSIPKAISPAVRHTIKLCLEKDPRRRIADIRDVRLALQGSFESDPLRPVEARPGPAWRRAQPAFALIAGAVVTALVAAVLWPDAAPRPVQRFSEPVAAGTVMAAISVDGTHLAYRDGLSSVTWVRRLDEQSARSVPGADAGPSQLAPCFSPDASWLAYSASNGSELRRIPVAGGVSQQLVGGGDAIDWCDWGEDGNIYFGVGTPPDAAIRRVPASGGPVETLVTAEELGALTVEFPVVLPGGDALLVSIVQGIGTQADNSVAVLDLATRETSVVLDGASFASFVPGKPGSALGHLVWGGDGTIFAVPFDRASLRTGAPRPVLSGVASVGGFAYPRVSRSGTLAYVEGATTGFGAYMFWVDRTGAETILADRTWNTYGSALLSPDNSRAVTTIFENARLAVDLWIYEFDGGRLAPLTRDATSSMPVWLSDGQRLIYAQGGVLDPTQALVIMSSQDIESASTLVSFSGSDRMWPLSVSPDDRILIGSRSSGPITSPGDIWALPLPDSPGAPFEESQLEYLLDSPFDERHASFSTDGRYIAYTSDLSGQDEVYVQPYPGPGPRTLISDNGGTMPRWNPAGGELFYLTGSAMMVVEIETAPALRRSAPEVLFESPVLIPLTSQAQGAMPPAYDVAGDGTRFLMPRSVAADAEATAQLNIVLNWPEELARLAPFD